MKKIDSYEFGKMVIDGTTLDKDLIICGGDIATSNWRREKGHFLQLPDLEILVDPSIDLFPEVVIIGTGRYGKMEVDSAVVDHLKRLGVHIVIGHTARAVQLYNAYCEFYRGQDVRTIDGAFHLTC